MRKSSKVPTSLKLRGTSKSQKFKTKNLKLYKSVVLLFIVGVCYLILKNLYQSAFFQKKDRVNVVFSHDQIAFYSLGLAENVNYFISLYPDLEVEVPGGYGLYRLGALVKLSKLEKQPELIKKTYSALTSSFVDYYFYPDSQKGSSEIYFGDTKHDFFLPGIKLMFFSKSNARFFDRLFLYLKFLGKTEAHFNKFSTYPTEKLRNRTIFSPENFYKDIQGFFYKKTYRGEQLSAQILYTNSIKTAQILGQILEGEGIRVVDVSENEKNNKNCEIIEDKPKFSITAMAIKNYFGCKMIKANTGAYDIIYKLGDVEEEWEIR